MSQHLRVSFLKMPREKDSIFIFPYQCVHPGTSSRCGVSQRPLRDSCYQQSITKEQMTILLVSSEWFFFSQKIPGFPKLFCYFLSTQFGSPQTNLMIFSLIRWSGLGTEEKTADPDVSSAPSFISLFFYEEVTDTLPRQCKWTKWGTRRWIPKRLLIFWVVILKWFRYYLARPQ